MRLDGRSRLGRLLICPEHRRCLLVLGVIEVGLVLGSATAGRLFFALWLTGLLSWSLVEYLLHRFLFHVPVTHALAKLGARHHHAHHRRPDRPPITKPLALTLPVIGVAAVLAAILGGLAVAVVAGLVGGYLCYEVCHVAAHVLGDVHPVPRLRDAHLLHHERSAVAFGITSPLWDRVFGTQAPDAAPKVQGPANDARRVSRRSPPSRPTP